MHRCLQLMSAKFREGRPSAAPQQNTYDTILGEDMEWQATDAVCEEFDDNEAELRLAEEDRDEPETSGTWDMEELLSMEEPWAADDGITDITLDMTNDDNKMALSWLQRSREHNSNHQTPTIHTN